MNSRKFRVPGEGDSVARDEAARWVVRRDRGLTPEEAIAYEQWLRADPRHEAAMARSAAIWNRFGSVPVRPMQRSMVPARRRSLRPWFALGGLAAAVALILAGFEYFRPPMTDPVAARMADAVSPTETLALPDGTVVRLNVGAAVSELFTATERRVRLVRGEAYFAVARDSSRPFFVDADRVSVRAVGTAFNVALMEGEVDVLVTEGTVEVSASHLEAPSRPDADPGLAVPAPLVTAGQRAVVALVPTPVRPVVVISDVNIVEVSQASAWRGALLRLGGSTLAELALEFERKTDRKLILADPSLGAMRVGGRFPGEDVEGFVRVLEINYGIRVERAADGTLILDRAP